MKKTFFNLSLMGVSEETLDELEKLGFDIDTEVTVFLKSSDGKKVVKLSPDDCQLDFDVYEEE